MHSVFLPKQMKMMETKMMQRRQTAGRKEAAAAAAIFCVDDGQPSLSGSALSTGVCSRDCLHNFHCFWILETLPVTGHWQAIDRPVLLKLHKRWGYPYFDFENYRNSWNLHIGSRVRVTQTGPRSQNCAEKLTRSHKNGPSATRSKRHRHREFWGWVTIPLAGVACCSLNK